MVSHRKQAKSLEYAGRILYMIERRAIRDLIIRAQLRFSAEKQEKGVKGGRATVNG